MERIDDLPNIRVTATPSTGAASAPMTHKELCEDSLAGSQSKQAEAEHDTVTDGESEGMESSMEKHKKKATHVYADAEAPGLHKDYEELKEKLSAAENAAAEAQTLYQRMAADFENYRKRIDRERQEFLNFGVQKAVEVMIPALDDLDRAKATLNADMKPEDLLDSIKLVFNRITQSLEQMGVRSIADAEMHFDPQYHEPVQQIATTDFPDGTVTEVLRKGYMLNDKVIRPALVNVACNRDTAAHGKEECAEESEIGDADITSAQDSLG